MHTYIRQINSYTLTKYYCSTWAAFNAVMSKLIEYGFFLFLWNLFVSHSQSPSNAVYTPIEKKIWIGLLT